MAFYGGFETHGILRRFLNSWYLVGVLKDFFGGLQNPWGTKHVPQG